MGLLLDGRQLVDGAEEGRVGALAFLGQGQQTKDKADSPVNATAQKSVSRQSSAPTTAKPQALETQGEKSENGVDERKSSGGGLMQGIKVHGHWTIEVRNPDGTLVTHREFENSLRQSTGSPLLANLLNTVGQTSVPGSIALSFWAVELGGGACFTLNTQISGNCGIIQAGITLIPGNSLDYLSSQKLVTGVSAGSFVLSGTVQASDSSSIVSVTTETINEVTPSLTINQFTSASLSSNPVQVQAGQTIAVTVNISFS